MLSLDEVNELADRVARHRLGTKYFRRAFSEESTTFDGEEAVTVTLVITKSAVSRLKGSALIATLSDIQHEFSRRGDARLSIVSYATEEELADATSES